ncbi:hypothetical protein [Chryseobacterium sp. EO14]|uniref:hypothetical protein n=1 Tax=Chryseobacterium sp. EO14 TaxID=2950551 RepID=UPI00210E18C2|nr:hypothetical protein [Chryseobacterium sp. EO14]MCQ4139233.1 hypothetical protein [Chryseobacterium sp. EO14]
MECLNNIIKFKSLCETDYKGRYVEDFVQVDSVLLSNLTKDSELNGNEYGESLIDSAVQNVLSDVYTSYGNTVLENAVEALAFFGYFNQLSMNSGGFSLRNMSGSTLTKVVLKSLKIKALFDGDFTVVIDDGKSIQNFEFTASNGIEEVFPVEYETTSQLIKVYCSDNTKQFSQITATKKTCGSCSGVKYNLVLQPLKDGKPSNTYSTFIPEAILMCDSSGMICKLLQSPVIKQAFIKAVAIQCGISVYERLLLSTRMNDNIVNIDKEAATEYLNTLVGKYQEFMFGDNFASGNKKNNIIPLSELIKRNIKTYRDICVSCNSIFQTSTVLF